MNVVLGDVVSGDQIVFMFAGQDGAVETQDTFFWLSLSFQISSVLNGIRSIPLLALEIEINKCLQ